jgi:hypothetical protein
MHSAASLPMLDCHSINPTIYRIPPALHNEDSHAALIFAGRALVDIAAFNDFPLPLINQSVANSAPDRGCSSI